MKVNVNLGKKAIASDVLQGECFVYDLDFYMRIRGDNTEVRPVACEVNERKD